MDLYRIREIAINTAAYTICFGATIYCGVKAPTIFPNKQISLDCTLENPSQLATKLAKMGVGGLVGLAASGIPTTFAMACLGRKGYVGKRNSCSNKSIED